MVARLIYVSGPVSKEKQADIVETELSSQQLIGSKEVREEEE